MGRVTDVFHPEVIGELLLNTHGVIKTLGCRTTEDRGPSVWDQTVRTVDWMGSETPFGGVGLGGIVRRSSRSPVRCGPDSLRRLKRYGSAETCRRTVLIGHCKGCDNNRGSDLLRSPLFVHLSNPYYLVGLVSLSAKNGKLLGV